MRVGAIKYSCMKCGKSFVMDYFPDIRTGKYNPLIEKLFDTKLCKDCYIDEYIPQAAENLVALHG